MVKIRFSWSNVTFVYKAKDGKLSLPKDQRRCPWPQIRRLGLQSCRTYAEYWKALAKKIDEQRCKGLAKLFENAF